MVYQTEKILKENGDKLPEEDKTAIQTELEKVKKALEGTDSEAIKSATDGLTQKFHEVSTKMYQQANPQGAPDMSGADMGGNADTGDAQDADFKEI